MSFYLLKFSIGSIDCINVPIMLVSNIVVIFVIGSDLAWGATACPVVHEFACSFFHLVEFGL